MPGDVATSRGPCPGNGVPVFIKKVVLYHRKRGIMTDAIAQAVVLALMDEIVVNMVPSTLFEVHRALGESRELTVVYFYGKGSLYSFRNWKSVVVFPSQAICAKGPGMMLHMPFRVRTLKPDTGNAYTGTQCTHHYPSI